jgi:hypothetical protein
MRKGPLALWTDVKPWFPARQIGVAPTHTLQMENISPGVKNLAPIQRTRCLRGSTKIVRAPCGTQSHGIAVGFPHSWVIQWERA